MVIGGAILERRPELILYGIGAAVVVLAWTNPSAFAALLARLGVATVKKAGEVTVELASNYGAPALAVKAGDSLATTSAGTWLRSTVGLPDLNAADTVRACDAALAAGDDIAAAKYCGPLKWASGWFDGK